MYVDASMRPPDLPGGNPLAQVNHVGRQGVASMRPPIYPAETGCCAGHVPSSGLASMRPPDLPGGNAASSWQCRWPRWRGFNEAAGFTRRKRRVRVVHQAPELHASMRPPDLPGGNSRNRPGRRCAYQ